MYNRAIEIKIFICEGTIHSKNKTKKPVTAKALTCHTKWNLAWPVQSGLVAWDSLKSINGAINPRPKEIEERIMLAIKILLIVCYYHLKYDLNFFL